MYWLKGCDKCGGDLYLERDKFGSYVSCLQCGAIRLDFDERTPAVTPAAAAAQAKATEISRAA